MKYIEKDFPIEKLNEIALKEANAKKPIYQIHKWWARRLGSIFRMIILTTFLEDNLSEEELWKRFYSRNDLGGKIILDPFMGGGTTVVEALRLGCKVIGVDINPVAWFVTKKEVESVDLSALEKAFREIEKAVAEKIKSYYKTACPHCYHEADVIYVFWVKKVKCVNCGEKVPLFDSFRLANLKDSYIIFCPDCKEIMNVDDYEKEVTCRNCGKNFKPSEGYAKGEHYVCPRCGQKESILKAIQREGKIPESEMFAIEYYCSYGNCPKKGRGYKKVDEQDLELYERAKAEFEKRKYDLLFPRQKIPVEGRADPRPVNYGYEYFYQLFNVRQLLCLSMILEEIMKVEDQNIREFMTLTLSNCVNANNLFCKYNMGAQKIEPLFGHHAYWPPHISVENNVWGAELGRGTFKNYFGMVKRAKEFCKKPYEVRVCEGKTEKVHTGDEVKGSLLDEFESLVQGYGNLILKAQTAEDLSFIPNKKVEAIITDPPYYDNVMYSELADFFYVWLRLALKSNYDFFRPEYSPRAREIIKNEAHGKDDEFFIRGLTNAFRECNRVLKDDGLLVFTFHHERTEAWSSALKAILDANFYVASVYPIRSEPRVGVHGAGIRYDVIIVCKKRSEEGKEISWEKIKDQVFTKAEETLEDLWRSGRELSDEDMFVIAMGKCLEIYSKHHPNVMKNGKKISVEEAIGGIEEIIDSLVKVRDTKALPKTIDEESRIYVSYIVGSGNELSFDDLHKRLSKGGHDIEVFYKEKLLEKVGNKLRILRPDERREHIEGKIKKGKDLSVIDKIHYLYCLYKEGKPLAKQMVEWGDEALKKACELLYKKTGDQTYAKIAGIAQTAPHKPEMLKTLDDYVAEDR